MVHIPKIANSVDLFHETLKFKFGDFNKEEGEKKHNSAILIKKTQVNIKHFMKMHLF